MPPVMLIVKKLQLDLSPPLFVYLIDNQILNLIYSLLVVSNHHDQYQIEDYFNNLFKYYDRVV